MREFALVVPFDGLVEPAGVPTELPAHVTVRTAALVEPLLPLHSHVDSVVLYESADGRHWQELQTFDLDA
jgi:hypothetical protein